jgi:hypothetical protein
MDAPLVETIHKLETAGFSVGPFQGDAQQFGNWTLLVTKDSLAVRVTKDRDDIALDLMPRIRCGSNPEESDWFNWDVVARALGIDSPPNETILDSYLEHRWRVEDAFSNTWQNTKVLIAAVEAEKRRRFIDGRSHPTVPKDALTSDEVFDRRAIELPNREQPPAEERPEL